MTVYQEPLAALLTAEQGKPLAEARGEIAYAAAFLEWYGEEAKRAYGETVPGYERTKRLLVLRQPIGVVAAITPWNFPSAMVTRKVAPALAAGCTMVLKPSELTPFSALALGVIAAEAGVPAGVLNIITGDAIAIGAVLTASPIVRKLSFTGSTATGVKLFAQCAPTIKKLSLELGGNAPFIVFDDADLDAAVEGAMAAKFRNAGQTCVCANRFYVESGVHDAFADALAARIADLIVGPGQKEGVQIGPLINDRATHKVRAHIADAVQLGGVLRSKDIGHPDGGRFLWPALLTGVRPGMQVLREETFGPLAAIVKFESEAEALGLANATDSGLAAHICRAWGSRNGCRRALGSYCWKGNRHAGRHIHVIAPLVPQAEWPEVKDFAHRLAQAVAQSDRENFTAALPKVQRKGRIFVDYLRNQRGATAVMPYAVRARENAPVAAPITWKEMETIDAPNHYHIGDAAELVRRAASKALSGWGRADQVLPDL